MRLIADQDISNVTAAFAEFGEVRTLPGREITRDVLRDADVLLVRSVTPVNSQLLEGTPVRFVGSATAGADHVDAAWLHDRGIRFAHAPGSNAAAVAEYVLAAMLEWTEARSLDLQSLVLGVVGVGHVGSRVSRMARRIGMSVIENDPPLAERTGDPRYRPIEELLERCDIVSLHVPLAHDGPCPTHHMVEAGWLDRLREGAFLINTSRGDVIDEAALLRALGKPRSSGAAVAGIALDVWAGEPLIDENLLSLADFATPHVAGYSQEAKLAGAAAIYRALCEWADRVPAWAPPLPTAVSFCSSECSIRDLQRAVRQFLDLSAHTRAFKQAMAELGPLRGRAFDALRRAHERRREFAAANGLFD